MQSKSIGTVLIAMGILMMIYTGFTYKTTERVIDLGPLKVNAQKKHPVQWSPIVGVILLIGGVIVISSGKKNSI